MRPVRAPRLSPSRYCGPAAGGVLAATLAGYGRASILAGSRAGRGASPERLTRRPRDNKALPLIFIGVIQMPTRLQKAGFEAKRLTRTASESGGRATRLAENRRRRTSASIASSLNPGRFAFAASVAMVNFGPGLVVSAGTLAEYGACEHQRESGRGVCSAPRRGSRRNAHSKLISWPGRRRKIGRGAYLVQRIHLTIQQR